MKHLYLFLFSILLQSTLSAQSTVMPAHTKAARQVIQKDLSHHRSVPSQQVINYYPIYKTKGNYFIAALGKINSSLDKARSIHDGFDVGAVIESIVSLRIPLNM